MASGPTRNILASSVAVLPSDHAECTCHCRDGVRHAGYYLFWRERGKLRKRYLEAGDVQRVRDACTYRRFEAAVLRGDYRAAREWWHVLTARVRGAEHHGG